MPLLDAKQTQMERVAACLIVQNEREQLPMALASVAFCDEIIVVDGGSTDNTVEIARKCGAQVIENPWPGFARQRNIAIEAAQSDWILEVDADERISPELKASIEALLASPPPDASITAFALRHRFLGRPLGPSAKYPAYRTRLFRRGAYWHDESRAVHEGIVPRERPIVLNGDLEHELADTLAEALTDMWRYARLESQHIASATPKEYLTGIVLRPAAKLLYRTIADRGWSDGWRGILKISLDATSDAVVWMQVLTRGRGTPDTSTSTPATTMSSHAHFGRRTQGPAKVVVVAAHDRPTRCAERWLSNLQMQGLDVALISDEVARNAAIPGQTVPRLSPFAVRHALEVEMDLRAINAVVPVGRRARTIYRLLPPMLRPEVAGVGIDVDPEKVATLAAARVRP